MAVVGFQAPTRYFVDPSERPKVETERHVVQQQVIEPPPAPAARVVSERVLTLAELDGYYNSLDSTSRTYSTPHHYSTLPPRQPSPPRSIVLATSSDSSSVSRPRLYSSESQIIRDYHPFSSTLSPTNPSRVVIERPISERYVDDGFYSPPRVISARPVVHSPERVIAVRPVVTSERVVDPRPISQTKVIVGNPSMNDWSWRRGGAHEVVRVTSPRLVSTHDIFQRLTKEDMLRQLGYDAAIPLGWNEVSPTWDAI